MKLLHVGKYLPPVPGGMETSVLQLCQGLSELNSVEVSCLVSNTHPKTIRETIGSVSITRAARFGSLASTPICPTFRSEGLASQAELLHIHLPNPLATVSFRDCKKPYVVTYHCDIVRYQTLLSVYRPSMIRFLKRASRVIVTSKELLESSPVLREVSDRCQVIPLGISTAHLEQNEERTLLSKELQNRFGERIVLFVGRLVPYKGLDDLILAMKSVTGHLLIVGQGPQKKFLEDLVSSNNLADKVTLAGYVPDEKIGAYYHAAQMVALTSRDESEALGMCLIEGLSCSKPLLTTRLRTGVLSVNLENETGLHVNVGDRTEIARKLGMILDDPQLAARLGAAGLKHFKKSFERSAVVNAHLKLYEQVLS
jgi:glycosyltransferase involved in cell wall biosynthesis